MSLMGWKVEFVTLESGISTRGVVIEQNHSSVAVASGANSVENLSLDPAICSYKKISPQLKNYIRHFCRNAVAGFSFKELLDDFGSKLGRNDTLMRKELADYRALNHILIAKLPDVLMKNILASEEDQHQDDDDEDEDSEEEDEDSEEEDEDSERGLL